MKIIAHQLPSVDKRRNFPVAGLFSFPYSYLFYEVNILWPAVVENLIAVNLPHAILPDVPDA
ncbi:MAG: hypothetical protein HFG17_07180 [Oscillospiraceae bacterium]|nr:hypothetical protein [Oscillospiraceae bacterium]